MRDYDWSASPLGAPSTWPQSLRSVVDLVLNSRFPMFVAWGEELGFLYNDPYAEILGSKHPQAIGGRFQDIWAEIWSDISPLIDAALAGEATYNENLPLLMNRKGFEEQTWFTFSYSPVHDESGRVAGMFCAVAETTGQVLAERQLREGESRFRALVNASSDAVYRMSADGTEMRQLDGHNALADTELASIRWIEEQLFPEDRPDVEAAIDAAKRARSAFELEHRVRRADGSAGWTALRAVPLFDDAARIVEWFGMASDVTARRMAEVALRESEARFRHMADAVPQIVWIIDAQGRIEFYNRQWSNYVGEPDEPPSARDVITSYVHPEDEAQTLKAIEEARRAGGVFEVEHRLRRADGAYRWFLVRAEPHHDPETEGVARWFGASVDIHDRKLVEAALQESETRFRGMADNTPVMMWVTDASGHCNYLNARWYEFTGQEAGHGEGLGWLEAVHPEDRPAVEEAFLTANAEQRDYRIDFRLRRADGVYRWTIDAAAARFSSDGEFLGYAGSVIDIDERREMESALREAKERLEERVAEVLAERQLLADLVEGTDAFVQVAAPDFRWLAINKAAADEFERLYDIRPRVGDCMLDLLAERPDQQRAVRALWERALAGEEFTAVGEFGDPGPDHRYHEMQFNVLRAPDGTLIGAYQFGYDVTGRIEEQARLAEAEAARRQADALYRAYFENAPEALFVVGVDEDDEFIVEETNPAHETGIGLKLADIRGRRIRDILPEPAAERVLAAYTEAVRNKAIYQYREEFELGEPRHWDTSLVPMFDETGRVVRLIGSSRDVTRQVVAEEALRQAQKMEAMGQLTGGVAHDFNNLLTPIVGALDMLQRKGLGDEREQRLIGGAAQSAERAKVLVQRLLAFARRQPLQPVPVDVTLMIRNMAELISSTTGPQIRVVVDAADSLPPARADPNQLEMALLNLAVNARDAMPEGGALRISASATRVGAGEASRLAAGRYIRLSVADTGTGMDEATLARAVEPFFSTKGVGKGTGLGLSMVHGLALQLGGALTINSRIGLGTNIELWLPQSDEAPETSAAGPEATLASARGVALLVDDEEYVRLSTADMLEDLGYRVVEAASAEEALRLIEEGARVDVVVTDHLMPGMTGTELARAIQELQPALPILIVSGFAEVEGVAPDLPRLTKPFRKSELAASLAGLST